MQGCFGEATDLEHAVVKTIWARFANELCSLPEFLEIPVVLPLQDSQPLLSRQSSFESICPSHEVVLGLVEDFLCLENAQQLVLPLNNLLGVEQLLELLNGNIGASTLRRKQLMALSA